MDISIKKVKQIREELDFTHGCLCQECGIKYKVDILVPDDVWDKIRPACKSGSGGLLCGQCIIRKIEELGEYDAYKLIRII